MQKTLGLILKKQNIGETDRILTIFSPTLGKKRVVVRAVRRTTSKLAGHLDTFMLSQLILTEAQDLPKVTSAVLVESFENVRDSLVLLERAYAISRIVERIILEDVSQQTIFQITLDAFVRLNDERSWPAVWLTFLTSLTRELGLSIGDFSCGQCQKPIQDAAYWLIEERSFRCLDCGHRSANSVRLEANAVKLLKLLEVKKYTTIAQIHIPELVASQVEEVVLREITQWFNKPWVSYASMRGRD